MDGLHKLVLSWFQYYLCYLYFPWRKPVAVRSGKESYKQHNIYRYSKHECQETSVYVCIAAFYLKVEIYESKFCLEKIYNSSSMWIVNKELNKYKI